MLVVALTAVAALVWVVKSLFEVEVRMNKIEESTEEIVDSLLRVRGCSASRFGLHRRGFGGSQRNNRRRRVVLACLTSFHSPDRHPSVLRVRSRVL